MINRGLLVVVLLSWLGLVWPGSAEGDCTPGGGHLATCDTEGEAFIAAKAAASANVGNLHFGCGVKSNQPQVWCSFQNLDWGGPPGSTGCADANGNWCFSGESLACADVPEGYFQVEEGASSACGNGCSVTTSGCSDPQTGNASCIGDTCLAWACTTGDPCSPSDAQEAPNGCTMDSEGTVVCDCSANPDAPFCPGGNEDDQCTDNGDGTVTCVPGSPPPPPSSDDPNSPGGPGDGTDDPAQPGPGESCTTGDPNCFNSGGGICQAGEQCFTGDASTGNEDEGACDPATDPNQCQGPQSASTSGSCEVAPTCDGNIIQCAIQKQIWKTGCFLVGLRGEKAPWEGDADYGRDLADEAEIVNISSGVDTGGFASGSCPANPSLDIFGQSIAIDMQPICGIAGVIRVFVILVTLLWAGPYIVRSF